MIYDREEHLDMALAAVAVLMIQARKVPTSDSNEAAMRLGMNALNYGKENAA